MTQTISLSEFARKRGITPAAVSRAVKVGRIVRALGRDARGRPVITDAALAGRELDENTSRAPARPLRAVTSAPQPLPRDPAGIPLERVTVWTWGDDLIGLAVCPDEDSDPGPAAVCIPMTATDAIAVGRWLARAAQAHLRGENE